MRRLLVASLEPLAGHLADHLARHSWAITHASSPAAARKLVDGSEVLVGLAVFPESGDQGQKKAIRQMLRALPDVKWIGAVPRDDLSDMSVKQLIAESLYDFQTFPINGERLLMAAGHAYGMAVVEREFRVSSQVDWTTRFGMIGTSPVMKEHFKMLQHAAESDVPVLITGPTGTGKEVAARAIHEHSARARGPFVALNCAAIPPSLLQAELFGHAKGAFTNAYERKRGHIKAAVGGTLLLDEIGDMPFESQATLLRFLEDKIVTPLGSTRGQEVDVRVIVSTNKDLEAAIANREFRADLYYRLAVLIVRTPSLSSRGDDIDQLADFFLREAIGTVGSKSELSFSDEGLTALRYHSWPGNIRELRSCVFQAVMRCNGRLIRPEHLNLAGAMGRARSEGLAKVESLQDVRNESERRRLELSLTRNGWNVTKTAKELDISRMTLYRLMEKHGLTRDEVARRA